MVLFLGFCQNVSYKLDVVHVYQLSILPISNIYGTLGAHLTHQLANIRVPDMIFYLFIFAYCRYNKLLIIYAV